MKKLIPVFIVLVLIRLPTIDKLSLRSDEPVYLLMSQKILEGHIPYFSFFFSHPPLFLWATPFAFSYIAVHIALIFVQALVLLMAYKITNNVYVAWALLFNITVLNHFNFYLGLGMMTLLLLLTYYYKSSFKGYLFLSMACCVRLYALPFVLGIVVLTKRPKWLLCLLPLLLMTLLIPNFFDYVFIYHTRDKGLLDSSTRWSTFFITLSINLPLIFALRNKKMDFGLLFLAGLVLLLIIVQKIIFTMYFSIVSCLLTVAVMKGLNKRFSRQIVICNFLLFIVSLPLYYSMFFSVSELAFNTSLPVTGQLSPQTALALINNLELIKTPQEPAGLIDTCSYRLRYNWSYFWDNTNTTEHLLVLWKSSDRNFYWWWDYNDINDYELVLNKTISGDELTVYLHSFQENSQ